MPSRTTPTRRSRDRSSDRPGGPSRRRPAARPGDRRDAAPGLLSAAVLAVLVVAASTALPAAAQEANEAPICRLREDPVTVDGLDPVATLDGGPTVDPDMDPLFWRWETSAGDVISTNAPGSGSWRVPPIGWSPPDAGVHVVTLTVTDADGASCSADLQVRVDDHLGVEAGLLDGPNGVLARPFVFADVTDETGDPVQGATVFFNVTYAAPLVGVAFTTVQGTTDAQGRVEVQVPWDLPSALLGPTQPGANVPGSHDVAVEATAANVQPFDEDFPADERAATAFTYAVPASPWG